MGPQLYFTQTAVQQSS